MIRSLELKALKLFPSRGLSIDADGRIWRSGHLHGAGCKGGVMFTPMKTCRAEDFNLPPVIVGREVRPRYLRLFLKAGKQRFNLVAHRLVWVHFFGPIPKGKYINHRNGNMRDNRPKNLEVCTSSENRRHALTTGLAITAYGERVGGSKLSNIQTAQLRKLWLSGRYTQMILARKFGISQAHVSKIIRYEVRTREL